MPVKQAAQNQSLTTGTPTWKTAIINVISYTYVFPDISCGDICDETDL